MIGLTAKQLVVLRFIEGFWQANHRAPSHREMSAGLRCPIGSATFLPCQALKERGHLNAELRPISPPAITRAPDGAPLYFVKVAA